MLLVLKTDSLHIQAFWNLAPRQRMWDGKKHMVFSLFEWCSWQMKKFIDEKHIYYTLPGHGLPTHLQCFSVLWRWGKLPRSFMTILHHTHLGHMLSTRTSQIPLLGPSAGLCGSQMSLQKLIEMYMEFSTQTTLFKTRLKKKKDQTFIEEMILFTSGQCK
jgi:hypothetical protein